MNSLLHWYDPSVKKLLGHRPNDEEEKWAAKAIEALVKKIKKRSGGVGSLEDLEFALNNPRSISKCVTIHKSLDGRLQVSHKKGLPHVIYCQVWRWPELQSHQELRAIPECQYPHDNNNKTLYVCINPYHYQRLDVPRTHMYSGSSASSSSSPESIPSPSSYVSGHSPPLYASCSSASDFGAASPSILSEDGDSLHRGIPSPVHARAPNPNEWACINYYELNTKVGDTFKVSHTSIVIDGFTNPSSSDERICLGLLSNVNRNGVIENTRRHIGKGFRLEYDNMHNVTLDNLSDFPIFVHSPSANLAFHSAPADVLRVPSLNRMCVFNNGVFYQMLENAKRSGQPEQLHDLQRLCFIKISFVKGWGPNYPRQDVTSTPCWVEIRLYAPLQWIDLGLKETKEAGGLPSVEATSIS